MTVLRRCFASIVCFLIAVLPLVRSQDSIYDHFRRYGLPAGLLPKGITEFSIDTSDGRFQVNLPQPCNANFENQVHYDFNVTGILSPSQVGELSGVSSQELFLWFPVKTIHVDVPSSGLIYFDVGDIAKQFSLSQFECPPDCAAVDPDDREDGYSMREYQGDPGRFLAIISRIMGPGLIYSS
ncbi:hypothetical protein SAY86_003095 [Trapa natans]|uniref:Uncharacterized protein n=1 Tax=Trapa natans TaxID=22666 RepID=A0AAN7R406_TRANT|nr:hypothetical protein SAY86_003095 [Trapa natans]